MRHNQTKCAECGEFKPPEAFEIHRNSRRSRCRKCRKAARQSKRIAADAGRVLPTPAERLAITNSFALWFGPVNRAVPLAWAP